MPPEIFLVMLPAFVPADFCTQPVDFFCSDRGVLREVVARAEVDVLNAEKIARLGAKVRRHERLQHDKRHPRRH